MGNTTQAPTENEPVPASMWLRVLNQYRKPDATRSWFEIIVTVVPFILLWLVAWAALSVSYLLALVVCLPAAGFLVRLFLIQHDCGHGSFFRKKETNDWVGRVLGVMTMTPYYVWRRAHAIHHATHGNLDKRGMGDINTLTVKEYQASSPLKRFGYRVYRHPFVLFGIGPAYIFLINQRWPAGFTGWRFWASAMGTNAAILVVWGILSYLVGWQTFVLLQVTMTVLAASMGVWLFYVQHQFEDTTWDTTDDWDVNDSALYGSSHLDLPEPLRWMTANIGVHHVHHLSSRIPFYRLQDVLKDNPDLKDVKRLTLKDTLSCVRLQLWDEETRKLISFSNVRALKTS